MGIAREVGRAGVLPEAPAGEEPLQSGEWVNMDPDASPSARWSHAMAYDSESDRIVLFGGRIGWDGVSEETW